MLELTLTEHFKRQLEEATIIDANGKQVPLMKFLKPYLANYISKADALKAISEIKEYDDVLYRRIKANLGLEK